MLDTFLVPQNTVNMKGDGPVIDISSAGNRVFLLTLVITSVIEQESLDVSVFASADGAAWGAKPIEAFPQKFYSGQHPMLLDLSAQPDIRFLRAHWELNRWGRGEPTPRFEFHITLREVPPDLLREATAEAKSLA